MDNKFNSTNRTGYYNTKFDLFKVIGGSVAAVGILVGIYTYEIHSQNKTINHAMSTHSSAYTSELENEIAPLRYSFAESCVKDYKPGILTDLVNEREFLAGPYDQIGLESWICHNFGQESGDSFPTFSKPNYNF